MDSDDQPAINKAHKSTDWPRITIVTPSYNQSHYIESTIKSVLSQDYPNLEYFVLDGGSKDGTIDIIKRYADRLTGWRSGPDDGPYAAVSEGFNSSNGQILFWLNSDDLLFPGSLSFVGSCFLQITDMQWMTTLSRGLVVSSGECTVWPLTGVSRSSFAAGRHLPSVTRRWIGYVQQESTFFRRELWKNSGGLQPRYDLAGDFALWAEFLLLSEVVVTRSLIGMFRQHARNRSRSQVKYISQSKEALENFRSRIGWKPNYLREAVADSPLARSERLAGRIGYKGLLAEPPTDRAGWRSRSFRFL
jgi:glycosyltransferase involved in cell wall biosynthesis